MLQKLLKFVALAALPAYLNILLNGVNTRLWQGTWHPIWAKMLKSATVLSKVVLPLPFAPLIKVSLFV